MKPFLRGVLSPVVTAFDPDYSLNMERMLRQCHWLQENKVGLALFGTTSEGNSLSVRERVDLMDHLVAGGLDPARMMVGTGACALADAVQLSAHAVKLGCAGVLTLPPFYYKGVSDEGLYRYYAEIVDRVGDARLRIYLYHIPQMSQVGISLDLIARLLRKYPGSIAGIKDSSEDRAYTLALLKGFAADGFDVFVGSEAFLVDALRHGGVGCITATANVNPAAIGRLCEEWQQDDAPPRQEAVNAVRAIFKKYALIPALKYTIAHYSGMDEWATVRPPLVELDAAQQRALIADLEAIGFRPPGLQA